MRAGWIGIGLLLMTLGPLQARAQSLQTPRWQPEFRRAAPVDGAVIVTGGLLYFGDMLLIPRRTEAVWHGPILWDGAVRNAVRAEVRGQRETAADVSDVLFTGSVLHNLVFDNLLIALGLHQDPDLAFQLSVINLEAYAIAGALTGLIKTATGRERPFARECRSDPSYSELCGALTSYRAFFSAHAATTAVGAGLLCAHHLHLPLYDGGVVDVGTCGLGIALTLVTGALRIASDSHWATDVTTGHLVGFASGYLVPTLLYYEWGGGDDVTRGARGRHTALLPLVTSRALGAQVVVAR